MSDDADLDVCWHCRIVLLPEPHPHCDQCPPFGECDVLGCDEPGCSGVVELDAADIADTVLAVESDLRGENRRLRQLLRRVIDDDRDPASLRALSRDIAVELGARDPLVEN